MGFLGLGCTSSKEPTCQCRTRKRQRFKPLGSSPGGGHGNLLQHSCLGNPMGGGAWWFAIYGVAQSQTRLKQLSSSSSSSSRQNLKIIQIGIDQKVWGFSKDSVGFPDNSVDIESACNAGGLSSIPGSGGSPGEGIGYHSSILGLPLWLSW